MNFVITWKTHLICLAISLLTALIIYPYINYTLSHFFLSFLIFYPTPYYVLNFFLYILIFMIPITIVHEGIHGLLHIIYGGKIKFGFKGIYAYTFETSGRPISRNRFITVLLSPIVLISITSLLIPSWFNRTFLTILWRQGC